MLCYAKNVDPETSKTEDLSKMNNSEELKQSIKILRALYKEGSKIIDEYEDDDNNVRYCAANHAVMWIAKSKQLFSGMFYNEKYAQEFNDALQAAYDSRGEDMDYHKAMSIAIGHLSGVGILIKNGYVKDQYSGIDNSNSKKAFVAMSFDPHLADNYSYGIKPAIEELGYDAIRMDKVPNNDKIDTKIIELISQSHFLVADFTGHRTGVYYEAGFARGIGIPVIQVCNSIDFDKLHFDIKTINTLKFDTASQLKNILIPHIDATIGKYIAKEETEVTDNDLPF